MAITMAISCTFFPNFKHLLSYALFSFVMIYSMDSKDSILQECCSLIHTHPFLVHLILCYAIKFFCILCFITWKSMRTLLQAALHWCPRYLPDSVTLCSVLPNSHLKFYCKEQLFWRDFWSTYMYTIFNYLHNILRSSGTQTVVQLPCFGCF